MKLHENYVGFEFLTDLKAGGKSLAFTLVSCSAYFSNPEDGGGMFLQNVS
jgi:hypothetical protein